MNVTENKIGNIYISYHAIAVIAFQAALESYGVVGLAYEGVARGITKLFQKDPTSGVVVHYNEDNSISVDMFLVIEYGTRISSVANSVASSVKFQIENATSISVREVNIHVRGLRVSDPD
jgi:uncharacterized alkaline shock family protein YloU